ncbi:MAG: CotH kinase family protein [Chitinophagales bacterium]
MKTRVQTKKHMRLPLLLVLFLSAIITFSQTNGDQIFSENQVLKVELQFSQPSFWDSLVANYTTETYMKADVTITDNTGIYTFNEIGIRLKGNSSYGHPGDKKSFKIDFNRYFDSLDYDGLNKLNFNNCFKDPTFMREKIVYDLSTAAGVHAPRCNYAEIYMNDIYWGFYNVVEQVDDDFLKTHFDNKSENLFKAGAAFGGGTYYADLKYYGTDTIAYQNRYSLENNSTENNWTDLMDLTRFINNSTDEVFADSLSYYFDRDELIKSLVIDNLFSNLDSYTNSARNYYIYHNGNTGLWEWIKWDCNEAFGSYSGGMGGAGGVDLIELEPGYFGLNRPLLERIVSIAGTRAIYDDWYCEIKNNYFTSDYLDPIIDDLQYLIQSYVYGDDNKMYSDAEFDENIESDIISGGPMASTIYGLRSFVDERNSYLEDVVDCVANSMNETIGDNLFIQIYPNPATEKIFIYSDVTSINIELLDLSGNILMTDELNGSVIELDISQLAAGIYFLKAGSEKIFTVERLVKL